MREVLRTIWTDPLALDPTRQSTAVTRDVADKLARLAQSLEKQGHAADDVAGFLMRSLFTMFAEDVGLLPERAFTELLERCRGNLEAFPKALDRLWTSMDTGGYDAALMQDIRQFNGGLFADRSALPVSEAQLELLIQAAEADWTNVEPAIFGTLLERALDPRERHKLGAHYTPRAYVERLVDPHRHRAPARPSGSRSKPPLPSCAPRARNDKARAANRATFHRRLCSREGPRPRLRLRQLPLRRARIDLKRLEAEVSGVLENYGRNAAPREHG